VPEVIAELTLAKPVDLRDLLIAGHISATGLPPGYRRLGVAWSQVMLEIGGGAAIWNFNVGNLKCFKPCRDNPANLWAIIPTVGPAEYAVQRAYVGPVEGCASYWRLINGKRYGPALPLFDAGEPYAAMMKLGELGYFTAEPKGYARAVAELYDQYTAQWIDPDPPSWGEENAGLIVAGAVLVGAAAAAYVYTR
jgi:hypothetical protein